MKPELFKFLIDPATGSKFKEYNAEKGVIVFENLKEFPVVNGAPVIIDEEKSLFSIKGITERKHTTQSKAYSDTSSLKNYIRRKVLPNLTTDFGLKKRHAELAAKIGDKPVLVLGAGEKIDYYKNLFAPREVINSDVHFEYNAELVMDAHQICFEDNVFGLVLASQVLEHCIRPWMVASEAQRVTAPGGYLHFENPFIYPYHAEPYDFFRYTFSGLRSLFDRCSLDKYEATGGSATATAVISGNFLIELFKNRYLRMGGLFVGRFLFGWLKYIDLMRANNTKRSFSSPSGISMTFIKDGIKRKDGDLFKEFYALKK